MSGNPVLDGLKSSHPVRGLEILLHDDVRVVA